MRGKGAGFGDRPVVPAVPRSREQSGDQGGRAVQDRSMKLVRLLAVRRVTAMSALAKSGVCFRTLTNDVGTSECWQQPELPEWEVPKRNPHERRPRGAGGTAVAEITESAAASDDAAGGDIAA
jgi:hypothetical protein